MNGRFTELLLTSVFLALVGLNIMLVKWNVDAATIAWAREICGGFGGALLMALRTDIAKILTGGNGKASEATFPATTTPNLEGGKK